MIYHLIIYHLASLVDFLLQFSDGFEVLLIASKQFCYAGWRTHLAEGVEREHLSVLELADAFVHIFVEQGFEHLLRLWAVLVRTCGRCRVS